MADDICEYYHSQFHDDVARFLTSRDVPYFGHSWAYDCQGLGNVATKVRPAFLVCLYFTVLVDQAMHAHFHDHYPKFAGLTRYPKFCHGLGQFQKNPRAILVTPIQKGLVDMQALEALLSPGMALFVAEVVSFLRDQMPEIAPSDFFNKLVYDPDVQIPEIFVAIDPSTKNQIEYKVYLALRQAIKSAFPAR